MENVFSFLKYQKKTEEELEIEAEREEIMQAIGQVKERLAYANLCLEFALDDALIDSLIYETISLQKKYDYYLRICKDRGFSVDLLKNKNFSVS